MRKHNPSARVPVGVLAAMITLLGGASAHADGVNTIVGVFSDVVDSGNILNDPAVGLKTFLDNSATAPASTFIGGGGSQLQWGTAPDLAIPASEQYSVLSFTGAQDVPDTSPTPIQIGTITYLNGTSDLNSIIFGAKLNFYLNSVTPANFLATDTVIVNTTSNQNSGTGLTLT